MGKAVHPVLVGLGDGFLGVIGEVVVEGEIFAGSDLSDVDSCTGELW